MSEVQAQRPAQCRGALVVQAQRPVQCRGALVVQEPQPMQCRGALVVQEPQPVECGAALVVQVLQTAALQAGAPSEVEPLEAEPSVLPVLLGPLPDIRRSLLKVLRLLLVPWVRGPAEGLI